MTENKSKHFYNVVKNSQQLRWELKCEYIPVCVAEVHALRSVNLGSSIGNAEYIPLLQQTTCILPNRFLSKPSELINVRIKLHNEELHNSYSSANIIRMME
jgi:hypothetical protein